MNITTQAKEYNGYAITPSAYRLPNGWFCANIVLSREDAGNRGATKYRFDAIDYFDDESLAIEHALAWALEWVDDRG